MLLPANRRAAFGIAATVILVALPFFLYGVYYPVVNFTGRNPVAPVSSEHIVDSLELEEAFLKGQTKLTQSDSCYLVLNLNDSSLSLCFKGIFLKKAAIRLIETSSSFRNNYPDSLVWNPFVLQKAFSSIVKHPVVVKKAPKDTIEAYAVNSLPVETPVEDVLYRLEFDKTLALEIMQEEATSWETALARMRYRSSVASEGMRRLMRSVRNLKAPDHMFCIRIVMSRDDAKGLFRALPENALMMMRK